MDLLKKEFDYPDEDEDVNIRGYKLMGKANESQVKKVARQSKVLKSRLYLPVAVSLYPMLQMNSENL